MARRRFACSYGEQVAGFEKHHSCGSRDRDALRGPARPGAGLRGVSTEHRATGPQRANRATQLMAAQKFRHENGRSDGPNPSSARHFKESTSGRSPTQTRRTFGAECSARRREVPLQHILRRWSTSTISGSGGELQINPSRQGDGSTIGILERLLIRKRSAPTTSSPRRAKRLPMLPRPPVTGGFAPRALDRRGVQRFRGQGRPPFSNGTLRTSRRTVDPQAQISGDSVQSPTLRRFFFAPRNGRLLPKLTSSTASGAKYAARGEGPITRSTVHITARRGPADRVEWIERSCRTSGIRQIAHRRLQVGQSDDRALRSLARRRIDRGAVRLRLRVYADGAHRNFRWRMNVGGARSKRSSPGPKGRRSAVRG